MTVFLVTKFFPFRNYFRFRLRAIIRGHRRLKIENKLSVISELLKCLRFKSLGIAKDKYSSSIFGNSISQAELILKQRLAMRESSINRALLSSLGKDGSSVYLALPRVWLDVIKSRGFSVASLSCSILWSMVIWKHFFLGCRQIFVDCFLTLKNFDRGSLAKEDYVYFCDLTELNLPQPQGNTLSHCIVNWYLHWRGRRQDISELCHSVPGYSACSSLGHVKLRYRRSPHPHPTRINGLARFLVWALQAIAISLLDIIRGRWWHALLLKEASSAAMTRFSVKHDFASQYFFHNSRPYPPLWTYELLDTKADIFLYFYSANDGIYPIGTKDPILNCGYSLMNWPNYLVWSEFQADSMRKCAGSNPNINVVGPIWFQDSGQEVFIPQNKLTIAVFDVQPQRTSRYCLLAQPVDFYVPAVMNKFISDISNAALEMGVCVFWKRKRDIGKLVHPSFERCAEILFRKGAFSIIEPSISATHVIQNSKVVISAPFTSTALIARHLCKPAIYYDPSFLVSPSDPSANGIPIIQGSEALLNWLQSLVHREGSVGSPGSTNRSALQ